MLGYQNLRLLLLGVFFILASFFSFSLLIAAVTHSSFGYHRLPTSFMGCPPHGLTQVPVPVQLWPQATLDPFRLNETQGPPSQLDVCTGPVLLQEGHVLVYNVLVHAVLAFQQEVQCVPAGFPVFVLRQSLHCRSNILFFPDKGNHGRVDAVAVGHPLKVAKIHFQRP